MLLDGQTAEAATARTVQVDQLSAARQEEIETLTARIFSLEQTGLEHSSDRTVILKDVTLMNSMVTSTAGDI